MPFSMLTSYFSRTRLQSKRLISPGGSITKKKKSWAEQRKHKRFQVPGGSFVSVGSNGSTLGQILDVSMGGLAFRYIGDHPSNGSHLDIFSTEHAFHLGKVRFKAVTDFEIDDQELHGMGGKVHPHCTSMRRGSVKFHKLSRKQKSQLRSLLRNYAVCEA
jgi:hypothetical protein